MVLRPVQPEQEVDHPRSLRRGGQGHPGPSPRARRRAGGELPARRARPHGLRRGAARRAEPGPDRVRHQWLWQHRTVRRAPGLRLHRPGDERVHVGERARGRGADARGHADQRSGRGPLRRVRRRLRPRRAAGQRGARPARRVEPGERAHQHDGVPERAVSRHRPAPPAHRQRASDRGALRPLRGAGRPGGHRAQHRRRRAAPLPRARHRGHARAPGVCRLRRAPAPPRRRQCAGRRAHPHRHRRALDRASERRGRAVRPGRRPPRRVQRSPGAGAGDGARGGASRPRAGADDGVPGEARRDPVPAPAARAGAGRSHRGSAG